MMGRCWQEDMLMLVLSMSLAVTAWGLQRSGIYLSRVFATVYAVAGIVVVSLMLLRLFDQLRERASDV